MTLNNGVGGRPREWPPDAGLEPKEYVVNNRYVYLIAAVIALLFGAITLPEIAAGYAEYRHAWSVFASTIGLTEYPYLPTIGYVIVTTIGLYVLLLRVVTPVHEWLHYQVARKLDLDPIYGHGNGWLFGNPWVAALAPNVRVWENLVMLIAPFVVIGIASSSGMYLTDGLIAGIAALVLLANSTGSCQDLYNYFRIARMDPKTKFTNFETDDGIRTEYVVPEE